jgi:hypothetical protein
MKTLSSLKNIAPGFLDRVITVRNKCDKVAEDSDFQDDLPVSAKNGKGNFPLLLFLTVNSIGLFSFCRSAVVAANPRGHHRENNQQANDGAANPIGWRRSQVSNMESILCSCFNF